jgi:primosomal protein N' (replication factor Y)
VLFEVAPLVPVPGTFTYGIAAGAEAPEPGRRVLVPFGRRRASGVVLGPASAEPEGGAKAVEALLDDAPLFDAELLRFLRWAADYYLYPIGGVLRAALPPGLEVDEEVRVALTAAGEAARADPATPLKQRELLEAAAAHPLARVLGRAAVTRAEARGWLVREARLNDAAAPPAVEYAVAEPAAEAELPALLKRAPALGAVLEYVCARGTVPLEELRAAFPEAAAKLRKLADRGLVRRIAVEAGASAPPDAIWNQPERNLTPEQAQAVQALEVALGATGSGVALDATGSGVALGATGSGVALGAAGFRPFLLHGATGSGKTEVYLRAIAAALARGRGALALVPEIALTPQLAGRFRSRFGADVAVLHSGLTDRERLAEWRRVRRGAARVVVGARSAVFAPVRDLGLVVVDEEHEPSFKQEEKFRYHARDLAVARAKLAGATVVLGSATPSLESLHNARSGRYQLLEMRARADGRPPPRVEIVDLADGARPPGAAPVAAPRVAGIAPPPAVLSERLRGALAETLARGEQAILFLNRRGLSTFVLCRGCGRGLSCPNCAVSLVHHARPSPARLLCHYCGHTQPPPDACPECGAARLVLLGAGTERAEDEVRARFPDARVQRLDRDAASARGKLASVLAAFARREIDVLVGTQMVAKGHDFPGVTLVGVVLADVALNLPDFRASERTFQLLAQVAGRAGRPGSTAPGRVLVQTLRADAPAVALAEAHDYTAFAELELLIRHELKYPPFARLLAVRLDAVQDRAVEQAAAQVAAAARAAAARIGAEVEVLGPAPAPIPRLRGRTRWQIMVRAPVRGPIAQMGRALAPQLARLPSTVRASLDIDPVAMM